MGTGEAANDLCYSLPRFITMGLQCSFCTYFWEMYTGEFGWSMPEYGVVSSIYSLTQIFTFVGFGVLFKFVIDQNKNKIQERLNHSKYILMAGTGVHWLTYFFLIVLPIGWYGVKLPGLAKFWKVICIIFIPFRIFFTIIFLPLRLLLVLPLEILCKAICKGLTKFWNMFPRPLRILIIVLTSPLILVWKILYILLLPFGIFWTRFNLPLGKLWKLLSSGRASGRNYLTPYEVTINAQIERERKRWWLLDQSSKMGPILADSVPDPPVDFGLVQQIWANEPETSPVRASMWCCFRPWCSALCRCIFSKKTVIYLLVIIHGTAVSAHELSNKALLTYMYSDFGKIGEALCVNLSFFFISNIVIIAVFSLVKNFSHSKSKFSVTFVVVAIVYMFITAPALYGFHAGTTKKDGSTATTDPKNPWKIVCQCLKWLCLTIWHSTVVFLIFSCGPLINYVSIFIMGGKTRISNFGVLAFLSSLNGTSWLFMIVTKIASGIGTDTIQLLLLGICIMGQSAVYFLFNHCNYLILIATGIINSVFVTYANIMLDGMVGGNAWKWLFCGGFYSGTNAALAWAMPTMFSAFGQDQTRHAVFMGIKFTYQYCFPTIYRLIAIIFQIASVLSYYIYGIAHYYDKQLDARRGLVDQLLKSAKQFAEAAEQFHKKAAAITGNGSTDADVQNFQAAAYNFKLSGLKFRGVAELLVKVISVVNCKKLKTKASTFQGKVSEFKSAAEGIPSPAVSDATLLAKAAIEKFKEAIEIFGKTSNQNTAAAKFQTFANELQSNPCNAELQTKVKDFKDKADQFATLTESFQILALLVPAGTNGDPDKLGKIKDDFKGAADKFGRTNRQQAIATSAAEKFYDAIKKLAGK